MDNDNPREWTRDEIEEQFLDHVRLLIEYWSKVEGRDDKRKLEGLAHSFLCIIDGATALPGFLLIPNPHKDDKEFLIKEGENWYPFAPDGDYCDIGGGLHELLYKKEKRNG